MILSNNLPVASWTNMILILDVILAVLGSGLLALYVWLLCHTLAAFTFPKSISFFFSPASSHAHRILRGRKAKTLIKQFEPLGFSSLGMVTEKAPLWGSHKSLVLASKQHRCFVVIGRRFFQTFYYFHTPFSTGEVVLTADRFFKAINRPEAIVKTVPHVPFRDVFQAHQKQQRAMRAIPFEVFSLDSHVEARQLFYSNPAILRSIRMRSLESFLQMTFLLFIFAIVCHLLLSNTIFLF